MITSMIANALVFLPLVFGNGQPTQIDGVKLARH